MVREKGSYIKIKLCICRSLGNQGVPIFALPIMTAHQVIIILNVFVTSHSAIIPTV